jgi:hypothetical protein
VAKCTKSFGNKVEFEHNFSSQTDGQPERTIQILEHLLKTCILKFGGSWEDHLPLVVFTYNNIYQTTIGITPYEALYGRKY